MNNTQFNLLAQLNRRGYTIGRILPQSQLSVFVTFKLKKQTTVILHGVQQSNEIFILINKKPSLPPLFFVFEIVFSRFPLESELCRPYRVSHGIIEHAFSLFGLFLSSFPLCFRLRFDPDPFVKPSLWISSTAGYYNGRGF